MPGCEIIFVNLVSVFEGYKMKKLLLVLLLLAGFSPAFATHNRAGEITYTHIAGFKYEITVTTYTNTFATTADRCEVVVYFGDGDSATAPRINGVAGTCSPFRDGVMIATNTRLNIYKVEHTYPGPGNYNLHMEDPNRNAGICNIPNSVNISFFLTTNLVINPFLPPNSSPVLLNPPIDEACVGQCFEHNPGAYDVEGDSLYYSLTTCYANGAPIFGYSFPPAMNANSINHATGDLVWCSPPSICQYNVAILIEEWKLYPGSSTRFYVGSILRDMQIDVASCINTAPQIQNIADTCILAGTNLNFTITATDADANTVTMTATGGPFLVSPAATFSSISGIGAATGTFNWTPSCAQVQLLPYQVTFKAKDNDMPTPLVNFESVGIRVIAPAITGLTAAPSGASIILNWLPPFCSALTGPNPLKKYKIYRKDACEPFIPDPCQTGVPSFSGYTQIGTTNAPVTTFTDNNNGAGLTHGIDYSYIVVALYADGSESVASLNVCEHLVRDVPIITNVSVISTGASDSIWTHWVKPLGGIDNLDTIANPAPYEYRLMRAKGLSGTLTFNQVANYSYSGFWQLTDTGYVSTGLNTQDSAYTFRVDFYSNNNFIGSTQTASSVFLSSSPIDNQVNLSWQEVVPWSNYRYDIYRETAPGSGTFTFVDSTTAQSYADTGLTNGITYCYKVISYGQYSDTALPRPLVNHSQIKCEKPQDTTPPCQPPFLVANDCGTMQNILSWQNPNLSCSNDAVQYNVYFAPSPEDPLTLIYSTTDMNNTVFTHVYDYEGVPSVAGCYSVTAVDSFGNESIRINVICVDNCPVYELPNVFTPNGDNMNDLFIPLPYRYVKDIDITIYDRWGLIMFQTNDPDILWDGKNRDSGAQCTDGTYFYVCTVNEIRLEGIVPRVLKGFIQLINPSTSTNN
jgi:gliding motility-associated-like protein